MRKKLVFEIVGLPGSGKSFLLDRLNVSKITKIDEDVFYEKCKSVSKFTKIWKTLFVFLKYFDAFFILLVYMLIRSKNRRGFVKYYIILFKYLTMYECIINTWHDDVVKLLDQGIVQAVWALTFLEKRKLQNVGSLKYAYGVFVRRNNIFVLYYRVDYELAARRAKERSAKCETDLSEIDELINLYKIHFNDCDVIKKYVSDARFAMFYDIEELEHLFKKGF